MRDLELVTTLAARGSTVRAAKDLHLTQSAVSRGLLLAEEKAGVRLFERTPRGLVPTPAGQRLLDGASTILAQLVALEANVTAASGETKTPPLRIVCECYTAYRWLPSTLARLKRATSALAVDLSIDHTREPVTALLDGDIDVALLTTAALPPRARTRFDERPLFRDEIVFVLSADHPLAGRATLETRDLVAYPLITSSQTPDAERKWFFENAFGKSNRKKSGETHIQKSFPIPPIRLPLTEAIIDGARAGMGIAVLSEWIASPYLDGRSDLVVKRLNGKAISRPWRIAFRRDAADSALRLAAALEHAPPKVYVSATAAVRARRARPPTSDPPGRHSTHT